MKKLIFAMATVAIATAGVVAVLALWAQDWTHALLGAVWLFLVSANFREWLVNEKRRDGFRAAELKKMHADAVLWTEQVVLAKALLAGRFADKIKAVGMSHDRAAIAAAGQLFEEIAKMELPEGTRAEIVDLHAKAIEAAAACKGGAIPEARVLH